jgi:hypothetical protein
MVKPPGGSGMVNQGWADEQTRRVLLIIGLFFFLIIFAMFALLKWF